ncbi:hypothetical protein GCM10011487_26390 [Steroidobacter agaridevorans]|uniref:Uncharacterized protein n=1 Tax=Steroidobacter agaridevorans TaxID=2695856 RepID=A0A829YBH4_9GAMM|nr:hypothetical protein [Steroidobacter agaridevorans]GFE80639.1 hypothetical protein GCM10011487_26390 [Steroidobacter agaridevorans]GFE87693.1 hypothetical protein GCM10011488_26470 [Steroidobacter agaridevorans]
MARTWEIAAVCCLGMAATLGSGTIRAMESAEASSFVTIKFDGDGACDARNNRLWLINDHTFKTIATTVRWRAAGGKVLSEEFYVSPQTVKEIGCAAEAEILEAKFADF